MKATIYCGDGHTFHVAATEWDDTALHAGRVPQVGEAIMPVTDPRWHRVVFVGWQLGPAPAVEVVAVADENWQPPAVTDPPGGITGSSRKIGREWCRVAVGTEARLVSFGGIGAEAFAWLDTRPERGAGD